MLLFVAAITFIVATCSSVQGLNYDDKEFGPAESGCPNLSVDPSLNITWLKSIDYWTIPLWSKKQLYLSVKLSATPEEFANTTEDTLRNSCFLLSGIKKEHSKVSYHGLNKKFFEWDASMRFNRDGIVDWFKIKDFIATTYVVLTNNSQYFLAVQQLGDGSKEYFLVTLSGKIPQEEVDKVNKKLDSLGFPKSSGFPVKSDCENDEYVKSVKMQKELHHHH